MDLICEKLQRFIKDGNEKGLLSERELKYLESIMRKYGLENLTCTGHVERKRVKVNSA